VDVDRNPVAFMFLRDRLEQVERALQVLLNRRLGGGVVELLDRGGGVHKWKV